MQCATRSSGRVRLNDPRNDLASGVRALATTTASRIGFSSFRLSRAVAPNHDCSGPQHHDGSTTPPPPHPPMKQVTEPSADKVAQRAADQKANAEQQRRLRMIEAALIDQPRRIEPGGTDRNVDQYAGKHCHD